MTLLDPAKIQRQIVGTWQLPIQDHYSETITLHGAPRRLIYTCSAASQEERLRQFFVGDELYGNWQVRSTRKISSLMNSPAGGSVRGSVGGSVGFIAPRFQKNGFDESDTLDDDDIGPFLVLNFTDIAKSLLNINLIGVRVDIANWLNNFREMVEDDCFKIVSLTENDTRLTLKAKKGIQVWTKIQNAFSGE